MSGSGRMNLRLASSYREDDYRRVVDHFRRRGMITAGPDLGAASSRPARSAARVVRAARAAIHRLAPRTA
jgi:hypothetical protein